MYDMVPLGTFATIKGGSGFPEIYQGNADGEYPFIKVSDMNLPENKREIYVANNYVGSDLVKALRLQVFPKNTVVFAKVGAAVYLNKRRVLTKETIIDNNMMGIVPLEIDSGFLYQFLLEVDFSELVQPGALPSINQEIVSLIPVPSISKEKQQQISHILTTVDNLIEKTQSLIDKYTAVKQGMMHDLFTRGIDLATGQLRSSCEQAPELYKETELGWVPREWDVNQLSEIYDAFPDGNYAEKYPKASDFLEEGVPFIRANNIINGTIDGADLRFISEVQHSDLTRGHLKSGDCLITTRGDIGQVSRVPDVFVGANINAQLVILRHKSVHINYFIFHFMHTASFGRQLDGAITGTALKQLPTGNLKKIKIPMPVQKEASNIVSMLDGIDKKIQTEAASLALIGKLKKGLMQDLLTGRVGVKGI